MKLKPLADGVLVEVIRATKTAGGLVIPDSNQADTMRAKVLAVGAGKPSKDGTTRVPVDCKVGDTVVLPRNAGFPVDGFLMCHEHELVAVEIP